MRFDIKKFTQELQRDFQDSLSIEEAENLMELNEAYNKDSPLSTGKCLFLTHISFLGEKLNNENEDLKTRISYHQKIEKGINIWIADNFKGKSSILKIIKYALTGKNSIKKDISKWIKHVFLNFNISDKEYTIYLNLEGRLNGYLLNGTFKEVDEIKKTEQEPIIFANSEKKYQEEIEDFFFKQFSYYSLKWTQKNPSKDKNDLLEASASWITYFKSILLESKDSNSFYGSQEKKVFQMLLGLELTYPINQLSLKKDMLMNKKSREQSFPDMEVKSQPNDTRRLLDELLDINQKIERINSQKTEKINLTQLYSNYNLTLEEIKSANEKSLNNENRIQKLKKQLIFFNSKISANNLESNRIIKEINNNKKKILGLVEYIDIGIFFSNLDIKHCPSCNHTVSKNIKPEDHKCILCNEDIENLKTEEEKENYKEKIIKLENENIQFDKELKLLELDINYQSDKYNKVESEIIDIKKHDKIINDISLLNEQLKTIETTINTEKQKTNPNDAEKENLISRKAVVEYQISELEKLVTNPEKFVTYDNQIEFLNIAINKLNAMRYESSKLILKNLRDLMLSEIHKFGLNSISDIEISDKFDIRYKQNGDFITFDDIAEGEQLRAKIAFYLSLIQLDIEHNFGKHTRFLIIDSPSKEEGDAKYLEGLSSVLQSIQDRFGDQLQILIGTAERGLTNVVKNQYITPEKVYVF